MYDVGTTPDDLVAATRRAPAVDGLSSATCSPGPVATC